MSKYKIIGAVILTMLTLPFSSCNKFLELYPQNGRTSDQFWQTKEDLQAATIAIYTSLNSGGTAGPVERFFMWGELRADFVYASPFISTAYQDVINYNILPGNSISYWGGIYRIINLCNLVIKNSDQVKERDNTLTELQLRTNKSEALAIRALMYFYLTRTFGDVPLKLSPTISDDEIVLIGKSKQAAVFEQIVADLIQAEELAVDTYGINAWDKGRITKFSINAIQADVYLWMDRYADCLTACQKIKNSGRFALVSRESWFNSVFVEGNSREGIFELQFDSQVGNQNPFFDLLNGPGKVLLANPTILDKYYTLNLQNVESQDIRGLGVAINGNDQSVAKYATATRELSFRHWIFYRYADILLMEAEARALSGEGATALALIKLVRDRGNALQATEQNLANDNINGIIDYILAERAREFAFEGKRWFDLLRNARRNNFARRDLIRSSIIASVSPEFVATAIEKINDPNSLYLPISLSEIFLNPELEQNPFYK